jgi:hypothetical protein
MLVAGCIVAALPDDATHLSAFFLCCYGMQLILQLNMAKQHLGKRAATEVLRWNPRLLLLDLDRLAPSRVEALARILETTDGFRPQRARSRGGKADREMLVKDIIRRHPQLLTAEITGLVLPRVTYLNNTVQRAVGAFVSKHPR